MFMMLTLLAYRKAVGLVFYVLDWLNEVVAGHFLSQVVSGLLSGLQDVH